MRRRSAARAEPVSAQEARAASTAAARRRHASLLKSSADFVTLFPRFGGQPGRMRRLEIVRRRDAGVRRQRVGRTDRGARFWWSWRPRDWGLKVGLARNPTRIFASTERLKAGANALPPRRGPALRSLKGVACPQDSRDDRCRGLGPFRAGQGRECARPCSAPAPRLWRCRGLVGPPAGTRGRSAGGHRGERRGRRGATITATKGTPARPRMDQTCGKATAAANNA